MESGIDGVSLFTDGMKYIGLGHVAKRFIKKYTFSLGELRKRYPNNDAAHLVLLRQEQGGEGGGEQSGSSSHGSSEEEEELPAPSRGSRASLRGRGVAGTRKRALPTGGRRNARGGKTARKATKDGRAANIAGDGAKSIKRSNEQQVRKHVQQVIKVTTMISRLLWMH